MRRPGSPCLSEAEVHARHRNRLTCDTTRQMMEVYREVPMADAPYQKAPGTMAAVIVVVVLLLLIMVAFATSNGEFNNWM